MVLLLATIALLSMLDIHAQGSEDSIVFSIDLDNVVITGQDLPTDSKNASYKVISITEEEIRNKGQIQVQEALALLPNVRVNNDPVLGTTLKLRGIGSDNVSILIDGVPVVGRLNGGIDLSHINLADVKRIELIEGPLSTLYGNNAAGGVINIIMHKSMKHNKKLRLDTHYEFPGIHNYGINGTMQMHGFFISASGRYLKHQLYDLDSTRVVQTFVNDDGEVIEEEKYPWNPKEQWAFNSTLRYNFDEQRYLIYKYARLNEEIIDLGKINRPQFKPYAWDNNYSTLRGDHSLFFHQEWDDTFFDITLALNNFRRYFTTERFNFDENQIDPSLTQIDTNQVEVLFAKVSVNKKINKEFQFLAGANLNNEFAQGDRVQDPDDADAKGVGVSDLGLFGKIDYTPLEQVKVSGAGRWFYSTIYENRFTPSFQIKWNSSESITWRGSYSTGYRVPSLKERFINFIDINHYIVSNPDLDPESIQDLSFNVALEKPFHNQLLQVDLGFYNTSISDKIVLAAYEVGKFNYRNLESFRSSGINAGIKIGNKKRSYSGGLGIGYWDSNEIEGSERKPVFDMQHSIESELYNAIKGNIQWRHVGSEPRFVEVNGVVSESKINAYNLVDLHIHRPFANNKVHIGVGIKNLLNISSTVITGATSTGAGNPHETGASSQLVNQGRTIYIKMSTSFH